MKTKILTIMLAMVTVVAFSQNREIRRAGNAVEDGDYQEAKDYLNEAEVELSGADQDKKAEYYLYKGQAFLGTGENVPTSDLMIAAESFQQAQELGSEDAGGGITAVSNALVNLAIADQNAQDYEAAAEKLHTSYQLNEQDTIYLYYAASNAVNAQDYDTALEYYIKLKDLGFTGISTQYTAVNKETGETESFGTKDQRDLFIQTGNYTDPQQQTSESKAAEIAKNIALIYIENGETDEAIAAMEDAKAGNPNDASLLQAEANMYYELGNMEKYREIMEEVVAQNPNDPNLYYNLGVSSAQLDEYDRAMEYYKKAIELDPEMTNARINLAFVILSQEEPLIAEMNELGTSAEDNARYEELSQQRTEIFESALPHLEVVLEKNPGNLEAARTMMNIYYQIGESEKAEEMKERIAQIESGQ